jgi:hypothetical protein
VSFNLVFWIILLTLLHLEIGHDCSTSRSRTLDQASDQQETWARLHHD